MNVLAKLEALLFVAGNEGISLEELADLLTESTQECYQYLINLQEKLSADEESGIELIETGNQFRLVTKKETAEIIKDYARSPLATKLSKAALETLAIIAYKQPITRSEMDEIRGVQSSNAVHKLLLRNLIEEKGRVEGPGRAILYGTSNYFMDYFGLHELSDLPSIQELEAAMPEEIEETDLFFEQFQEMSKVAEMKKVDKEE